MKKIFSILLMIAVMTGAAAAQEQAKKQSSGFADWLRSLQQKISQIVPKRSIPMSTSVAGVRAAKEDAHIKLYWKGKQGEGAVTEDEMDKFKACVDLVAKGDRDASIKQLEDFMKQYPDSALIPDAKKTLDLVKAGPLPEEKVEEKSEEQAPEVKQQENKNEKKEDAAADK